MTIRYKVVKRKTRMSALINGHSQYALRYLPGSIVVALPETVGIMTFRTKSAAIEWAKEMRLKHWPYVYPIQESNYREHFKIIKVEPLSRGRKSLLIASNIDSKSINSFYNDSAYYNSITPPENTICYQSVKVLE